MFALIKAELPTLITLFVTSVLVPFGEQVGFPLSTLQQQKLEDWINIAIIVAATGAVKLLHRRKEVTGRLPAPNPAVVKFLPLLVALPLVGLAGCALLQNPTFDAALEAVIYEVVGALLNKNPAIAPIVSQDASILSQLVQGNTAITVAQLQTQADTVIAASNLQINDKAAMEALIAGAVALLAQESAQIPPSAQTGLVLVFSDIQNAANLYARASTSARLRSPHVNGAALDDISRAAQLFGTH